MGNALIAFLTDNFANLQKTDVMKMTKRTNLTVISV